MFGWIEISLLAIAGVFLLLRFLPYFRPYHPLFGGACVLLLITSLFPRAANPIGQFLFGTTGADLRLPREIFGFIWWILGAWLFKSVFDLVLSRTLFPDNDEPHARRLFADLASVLIYVVAFIGIVGTVFNEPVSTFLATSGVVAIVLGLALQNTLGDVFAGLAINIERPYGAGDWITLAGLASGEVMLVNWRATRLRTWSHDLIVIPNAVMTKGIVTNHSRPRGLHRCILHISVDLAVTPARVIAALKGAAVSGGGHTTAPKAYACTFSGSMVDYELAFEVSSFAVSQAAKSDMVSRVAEAFQAAGIQAGAPVMDVRILPAANAAPARSPPNTHAA